jgi:endonuclease YncB( thermonuclease family)
MTRRFAIAALLLLTWSATLTAAELRVPVEVVHVQDGDTLTVEAPIRISVPGAKWQGQAANVAMVVPVRITVRLVDCYSPELHERGGEASFENMRRMALGKRGELLVDFKLTGDDRNLSRLFSFGRVLGDVYVPPYKNTVARRQVLSGHATSEKGD